MNRGSVQTWILAFVIALLPFDAMAQGFANRPEVAQFVEQMTSRHGFSRAELLTLFTRARPQPGVIKAMTAPAESAPRRSWQNYRAQFVNPARIDAGVRFYERHIAALERAAKEFGVPESVIVAIIGVETVYGRNLGSYRVVDALSTLAFDYPPRSEYFRGELEHFLLHARQEGIDVISARGSYAGAIGIPQFMPSSYRAFAVDYDGDGKRDLAGSVEDALGSVANYLKAHGWRRDQPTAVAARVEGDYYKQLLSAGIKPSVRAGDLEKLGIYDNPPGVGTVIRITANAVVTSRSERSELEMGKTTMLGDSGEVEKSISAQITDMRVTTSDDMYDNS